MRKYTRKKTLFPPVGLAVAALFAGIAAILIRWWSGSKNEWVIICCGIFAAIFVAFLFSILSIGHQYVYGKSAIGLFYFPIKYREIAYQDYSCICISNASYNNGYGYGVYGNIPMKYRSKGKSGVKTIVYPFITLHRPNYPVQAIKTTMSSRDLFILDDQDIFCLGICWYDSLVELLSDTNTPVYVLEDVYLRFREKFDSIFIQYDLDRFYIITDHEIAYKQYLDRKGR